MAASPEDRTQEFIETALPMMAEAATMSRDDAVGVYGDFLAQLTEVMGNAGTPGQSDFSWETAYAMIDETNANLDWPNRREQVTQVAGNASVMDPNAGELRIFEDAGTYVTVDTYGRLLAAGNAFNPRVPEVYGCIEPMAFKKAAMAFMIEGACHQGADWDEGYRELSAILHEQQLLAPDLEPTIGMASLHFMPYDAAFPNASRGLLAVSGTTGRTITPAFRLAVNELSTFRGYPQPDTDADFLAGWLDTQSSTVANVAAVYGVEPGKTHIVDWPDPTHRDNLGVNWN